MSQQTTNPQSNEVPSGKVEVRQHVILPRNGTPAVYRVEQLLTYPGDDDSHMVLFTLVPVGGGTPQVERRWVEAPMRVATEEQIVDAHDAVVRRQLQDDLVAFQSLLGSVNPRLRMYGRDVSFRVEDGEVDRIAAALSLPVGKFGTQGPEKQVTWKAPGGEDLGPRLSVQFWGRPAEPEKPAEPTADEPIVLDTAVGADLAAKVQAEVDAQPVEHQLDGGWKGDGPGQCGVRCTCDTTFDGFDSLAEAVAELHKHIANPEPEQEWLFTFGAGQQHDGRFVRIVGTYETARARMVEVFGTEWCDQYDWRRFDQLGLPAELTELPEAEWPTPAADAQTREIKARYLKAGMTVIDGTDGPMVVTSVSRPSPDRALVYFERQSEPTMFGLEVGVTVAADDAPAGGVDCADPWHEQRDEPTEPCPACGEHAFPVPAADDAQSGR